MSHARTLSSFRTSMFAAPAACAMCIALTATDPVAADTFVFDHLLEESQEVPPTGSPGTGECVITVDDIARTLDVQCSYSGLLAPSTAAHVHQGEPGVNGPPFVTLEHSGDVEGTLTGFALLTPGQIQTILESNAYINVHTSAHVGGEIRGQIVNDIVPPEPIHVGGLLHEAIGNASISGGDLDGDGIPDLLTISGIGASGDDGVRIVLSETISAQPGLVPTGWTGQIDFGPAGNLPPGLRVALTIYGNDPIANLSIDETDGGNAIVTLADACPGCTVNVQTYLNGNLVSETEGDGDSDVIVTGSIGTSQDDGTVTTFTWTQTSPAAHGTRGHVTVLKLAEPTSIVVTGSGGAGNPVETDRIVVTVGNLTNPIGISEVSLTAANTGGNEITITEEALIAAACCGVQWDNYKWRVTTIGGAHVIGTEVCDDGGGGRPPVCLGALEISNLGSSGDDGVTFGDEDVGGLPTESDALAGSVQPGRKIQLDPVILDLSGDGISTLKIESEWCAAPDPDTACGDSIWLRISSVTSSQLEFNGGPDGEASVHVDFSQLDTNEMVVSIHDSTGDAQIAPVVAIAVATNVTVAALLPGTSVQIESVTDASHAKGEHTPAFIWRFAQPVSINIDTVGAFTGDELRLSPGNGDGEAIVRLKGKNRTSITGGGSGGGSGGAIHITGIEPAAVSFTQGHVYGFQHTATDGAELTIGCGTNCNLPPGTGTNLPLVVSSSSCEGSVSIDIGDAAKGFGVTHSQGDEAGTLKGSMKLFSVTGQPSPIGAQLAFGPCPPPPDEDPLCDGVSPALDDPGYFVVDLTELGATSYSIQAVQHPEVIVADVQANPPQMARVLVSGHGGSLTVSGDLVVSSGALAGAGFTDGRYILRAGVPMSVQLPDDSIVVADEVRITAHGIEEDLTVQPVLSFECLPEVDDEVLAIIVDEWVELFDLEHRADGAAQLSAVCCWDPGEYSPSLILTNPSSGSAASVSSHPDLLEVIFSEPIRAKVELVVPDPCAGKPESCEAWPVGTSLSSTATLAVGETTVDVAVDAFVSADGHCEPGFYTTSRFAELGPTSTSVQVLQNEQVVATIPNYDGDVSIMCAYCGDAYWPSTIASNVTNADETSEVDFVLGWESPRPFGFVNPGQGDCDVYVGDSLRFVALSVESISGIINHSLTTIDIPEVHITDMAFEEPVPIPSCPADIDGNNTVNVFDLLELLAAWGQCADPTNCPADLDGNNSVNVFDLLELLAAWGPCP